MSAFCHARSCSVERSRVSVTPSSWTYPRSANPLPAGSLSASVGALALVSPTNTAPVTATRTLLLSRAMGVPPMRLDGTAGSDQRPRRSGGDAAHMYLQFQHPAG